MLAFVTHTAITSHRDMAGKKRTAAAGVPSGHTSHSSKLGALQAEDDAGKQVPDLLEDACLKSPAVHLGTLSGQGPPYPCGVGQEHVMGPCMGLSVEGMQDARVR